MTRQLTFSLVLATINRTHELIKFLESIKRQSYKNFELILVDQNTDGRLDPIVNDFEQHFKIIHLHSEKGLSLARNVGLKNASGDIIAFPDDDCIYLNNTLETVLDLFNASNYDVLIGKQIDLNKSARVILEPSFTKQNKFSIFLKSISICIFLKKNQKNNFLFDQNLGVGSNTPYGSGEETDYLIQMIDQGLSIAKTDAIKIRHPDIKDFEGDIFNKGVLYGRGRRYVLEKHNYSKLFILANIAYPLVQVLKNMLHLNLVKFYFGLFIGRLSH